MLVAGIVGTFMSLSRNDVPARRKTILLMLTLAATLPLVIAMVKRPALYNGIRHFIFVIPPMAVLAGVAFALGHELARSENRRSWQPAALAVFTFGLLLPLGEMIRLHPYQYTHFNHIAGTVRARRQSVHAGLLGPRAEAGFRRTARGTGRTAGSRRRRAANGRSRCAVRSARRRSRSAPTSPSAGTASAADFAMTLGEFYCKGLTAPVMVEIKRDDVVFARVYDIRGRSISSLLAIPAP